MPATTEHTHSDITVEAVAAYVFTRAGDAELDTIANAVRTRRKTLLETAAADLEVGQKAELINVRPAYYRGLRGTITAIDKARRGQPQVTLRLDATSTKALARASNRHWHLRDLDSYEIPVSALSCRALPT